MIRGYTEYKFGAVRVAGFNAIVGSIVLVVIEWLLWQTIWFRLRSLGYIWNEYLY